ncbi:hypothetical protein SISSUDRAFT_1110050 [Sistotremastrum suecicum HHB10207 ss-3]|uniref:Uncharacterized protein n=1 Tax=Sistotremastrum suecicum HHB10207 ss-3 TaxID=1314776 RepID=A0A166C036_9AGAM|nr:hypothetical protein SISSUDRAFT_1110050 [Sistotremastrum suecicum HHB10207 ss-3]
MAAIKKGFKSHDKLFSANPAAGPAHTYGPENVNDQPATSKIELTASEISMTADGDVSLPAESADMEPTVNESAKRTDSHVTKEGGRKTTSEAETLAEVVIPEFGGRAAAGRKPVTVSHRDRQLEGVTDQQRRRYESEIITDRLDKITDSESLSEGADVEHAAACTANEMMPTTRRWDSDIRADPPTLFLSLYDNHTTCFRVVMMVQASRSIDKTTKLPIVIHVVQLLVPSRSMFLRGSG